MSIARIQSFLASGRKRFRLNPISTEREKEAIVPLDIINDIQEFADADKIPGNLDKTVSFVPDFFCLIRTQRIKTLLTAIVSGKPDKVKEILDIDFSLL